MTQPVPPHSIEAEQAVLGSMLLDPEAANIAIEILSERDFYRISHQVVCRTVRKLTLQQEPTDVITMTNSLKAAGKLNEVGGTEYLFALAESVPTAVNVEHYAQIVKKLSVCRDLISVGSQLVALGNNVEAENSIDKAVELVLQVAGESTRSTRTAADITHELWELLSAWERGKREPGVGFGIPDLDRALDLVRVGQLFVVAADPGGGKSVLLNHLLANACKQGMPTLLFTCEMDDKEVLLRIACAQCGVDSYDLRDGCIPWDLLVSQCGDMSNWPLEVRDYDVSIAQVQAITQRWALQQRLTPDVGGLVVIDYLQLVAGERRRGDNRTNEVDTMVNALKNLTRRLPIAVATASQFSKRKDGRKPTNQDFRESSAIWHAADKSVLIHAHNDGNPEQVYCELELSKNRQGKGGTIVPVLFQKKYTRFVPCDVRRSELSDLPSNPSDWVRRWEEESS